MGAASRASSPHPCASRCMRLIWSSSARPDPVASDLTLYNQYVHTRQSAMQVYRNCRARPAVNHHAPTPDSQAQTHETAPYDAVAHLPGPGQGGGITNTVLSVMFFVTCGKVSCLITAPPCVAQKGFHPFHQRKEAGKICSLLQQVAAGVAVDCTSELRIRHPSRSVT